jgi:hypothetical protein
MKHQTDDGWDDWAYWAEVANDVMRDQKKQDDWLAWMRFRTKLFGPLD